MNSLSKRAKEFILTQMEELGEATIEDVMDLVRPHYIFDSLAARERAIHRRAHGILAQFRDEEGVRTCFNYKDGEGRSKYIDVDTTYDSIALEGVNTQLTQKLVGLIKAKYKVRARELKLSRQIPSKEFKQED